jgi:purine-binding chemotaxis protein CheW
VTTPSTPHAKTRAAAAVTEPSTQYLTFELGKERFAVPVLSVQEIRGWEPVVHIPHAPSYVHGVIDLRGVIVPIVDLRARLSMERTEMTATTVVIVTSATTAEGAPVIVGWVVDAVSDVADVAASAVRPPPEMCGTEIARCLRGIATVDDRLAMLLDISGLLQGTLLPADAERAA